MKAEWRKHLSVSFALEAWPRITEREEAPKANFARRALLPKIILRTLKSFFSCALKASFASCYSTGCEPPKGQLRIEAWRRNHSVPKFSVEKLRGIKSPKNSVKKIKGVELPEITGSQWIVLDSSWNKKKNLASKRDEKSLSKKKKIPTHYGALNDRGMRRPLCRKGCYLFACSSLGGP